jgi:hypothetical protein
MTKMVVPLAHSSSDKCVARDPTFLLPLKPDPHKDSSVYSASWRFKWRQTTREIATLLHKNFSSYGRERRKRDNHITRAYDLSELDEPWLVSVSFPYQGSSLFIAPGSRRDNYKRELKRGKRRASNAVKDGTVSQ